MEHNESSVRWSPLRSLLILSCAASLGGCAVAGERDERNVGTLVFECPTALPPEGKGDHPGAVVNDVLGFDVAGRLSWFHGETGRVLAQEAPRHEAALALTRDVAFDRWQRRAIVFESDEEGIFGEVSIHDMDHDEPRFEPRRHSIWVDGRARVMGVPQGVLVFEEGYGERWKLLRDDGVPTVSVPAPRPASVWLVEGDEGLEVNALASVPSSPVDGLQWLRAGVSTTEITKPVDYSLGPSAADPPVARMAPSALLVGAYVVDLRHEELVLSYHEPDGTRVDAWRLGKATGRIEQLLSMGALGDDQERLAVLLSDPGRVVVADVVEPSHAAHWAMVRTLFLDGQVGIHDRFFARDMVAQGNANLLVATGTGVVAIEVVDRAQQPALVVNDAFCGDDLRGPLALVAHSLGQAPD